MLKIPDSGALDFLAVGALVHRLDPGVIPFPHASQLAVHVSGGEYNCAANLASCFGMRTGIAAAMVSYPIGDMIDRSVRALGVRPFYKRFAHDGVRGPNMATVYSDRGAGVRAPEVFYNRANEAAARLQPGDFDWPGIMRDGVRWLHSGGIFAALSETTPQVIIEAMQAAKAAGAVVSFDLNYRQASSGRSPAARIPRTPRCARSSATSTCWSATRRTCSRGWASRGRRPSGIPSSTRARSCR